MKTNIIIVVIFLIAVSAVAQDDPVMKFYLDKLDSSFQQEYIFVSDAQFSVKVRSIFSKTDYRGKLDLIDTAVFELFYNNIEYDSINIIDSSSTDENSLPGKFFFFPPWYENFDFFFYPNDTGAGSLAIGFRPDSTMLDTIPTGLILIDRNNYKLQTLMLHDPAPDNSDRLSETFNFDQQDGFQIILNYESQRIKRALLGKQYSRQHFKFYDYRIKK